MFRPPSLLAPRIVPTAATPTAGQLGLLHPGTPCFVASARSGYANRLKTGNWRDRKSVLYGKWEFAAAPRPRENRPSPKSSGSGSRCVLANNDFSQALFRGCRYSVMFRPPSLLAPQIVPTAANTSAGQPGLLRPSRTRFVASPRIGYANRLKTGNW